MKSLPVEWVSKQELGLATIAKGGSTDEQQPSYLCTLLDVNFTYNLTLIVMLI